MLFGTPYNRHLTDTGGQARSVIKVYRCIDDRSPADVFTAPLSKRERLIMSSREFEEDLYSKVRRHFNPFMP